MPLTGASLTHAGKPARVGGALLGVFGWVALFFGLLMSTLFGLLTYAIFTATAGWVTGGILGLLSLAFFLGVRRGGQALEQSGEAQRHKRSIEALTALASTRGGVVRPETAARALDLSLEQADALLTELAKTRPDEVELEVSDRGELLYTFLRARPAGPRADVTRARVRVAEPSASRVVDGQREVEAILEAELDEADEASRARRSRD